MKANSIKTIGKELTFLILIVCVAVSISAQSYQLSGCVQDEKQSAGGSSKHSVETG